MSKLGFDLKLLDLLLADFEANEKNKKEKKKVTTKKKLPATEFERTGVKFILPEAMDYDTAIEVLQRKKTEEETKVGIYEEVDAYPLDGAFMLMKVLAGRYGWASPVPTPGFFKDTPPTMANLEVGYGENTQVIWGSFAMPGIEGSLSTGAGRKDGRLIFIIQGQVKKKHQNEVLEIAAEVRRRIREESVYKGAAIRLQTDEDGELDAMDAPKFLDLTRVNEEELVLPTEIEEQVRTSLFTPVEHTERCRQFGIPLKRGVLLEGKYGTGKTLTAYVTAKKCVANGWTFIYLDRVSGLDEALRFARQYSPSVIFAEDIDRVVAGEDRTVDIDDVLNSIDGIESKGSEIITILTTNHVDRINRAMLRPGRLDAVISITAPDAKAAERLLRLYGRDSIARSEDLTLAGVELGGQIPAVIREVVERSKLFAISRNNGDDEKLSITSADLVRAAKQMKHHLRLMSGNEVVPATIEHEIGAGFTKLFRESVGKGDKTVHEQLESIYQRLS